MTHRFWLGVVLSCTLAFCGASSAQISEKGVVSATGQATIIAQPDLVRVTIELIGQGKDTKDALGKLKEETESAKGKLSGLGIAAESIEVGDPTMDVTSGGSDARTMALAMMRQNRRTPAAPANQAKVSAKIEARLRLKGASAQDKLVEAAELIDKARAAFARKLTTEEQEIAEEMRGQTAGQPQPGEPQFVFVHVITEAERAKATADAVAQAKESATRLAQATGARLGPVRQLSESASNGASTSEDMSNYYYRVTSLLGQGGMPSPKEATSMQPGPVTFVISVSIGYALE